MSVLKSSKTKIAAVAAASVLSIGIFQGLNLDKLTKLRLKEAEK